jgi:alginate O-acetyltransferase complex protein AlgI
MNYFSLSFLFFALAAVLLLRVVGRTPLKSPVLLGLSAMFLAGFFSTLELAAPLFAMVAFGYLSLVLLHWYPRRGLLAVLIALLVLGFVWLKQYAFFSTLLPPPPAALVVVGLSYLLFRMVHLMIDVAQGNARVPRLTDYLNYCFFFPAFASGPIQRFEAFEEQLSAPTPKLEVEALHRALCRISLGIMMVVVASQYVAEVVNWAKLPFGLAVVEDARWLKASVAFGITSGAVLVQLYLNFSGSMHVLIGVAALAGFTLPENFNKPYLAKNFLDFWARWHITLSEWVKFYIFNPLLAALTRRFPSAGAATWNGALAFFVAFAIIGMWHGTTPLFFVLGLMLGGGAVANKLWQQFCTRRLGKAGYKALGERRWYFQLSRGLTFSYISVTLMCLWLEESLIAQTGVVDMLKIGVVGCVLLAAGFTLLGAVADAVSEWLWRRVPAWQMPTTMPVRILVMGVLLWVVINHVGGFGNQTPEIVYQRF